MKPNDSLKERDFLQHCERLRELTYLWNADTGYAFRFIESLGVYAGPTAGKTLQALVGVPPYVWLRRLKGTLVRRRHGASHSPGDLRRKITLNLPSDAVVIYRAFRGLVVISASSEGVLKLLNARAELVRLTQEEWVARYTHDAMAASLVPRLLDSGTCRDGSRWNWTALAPNTRPLVMQRLFPLTKWHRFRVTTLSTFLFELYRACGWESVSHEQWYASLQGLVSQLKDSDLFAPLLALAEDALGSAPEGTAIFSLVHGDLKVEHIHRSSQGCCIIDWGMSTRGPIAIDWFLELIMLRLPSYDAATAKAYTAWLRGEASGPPDSISKNLHEFYELIKCELGVEVPITGWRFQMIAATIHLHCIRNAALGYTPRRDLEWAS
jgi:hypothetical protein